MLQRNHLFLLFLSLCICACTIDEAPLFTNADALIFGTFYGECFGDDCVETYMVADNILYKDSNDAYGNQNRSFLKVSDGGSMIGMAIREKMTNGLSDIENSTIGCPDCGDQGGVYFETTDSERESTYWVFDQDKSKVPEEFHPLLDIINETVLSLR